MSDKYYVIRLASYLDLISILVEQFGFDSLFKTVFTAFVLMRKEEELLIQTPSQKKSSYVSVLLKRLHSYLPAEIDDFSVIYEAFYILSERGFLSCKGDTIIKMKNCWYDKSRKILSYKVIRESLEMISAMSVDSFCTEVIRYV